MIIKTKLPDGSTRTLSAWIDDGEVYIRESLYRGRDVQTVTLSKTELTKIVTMKEWEESK